MASATIGELDSYLFFEGTHTQSYHFMGSHLTEEGWVFRVWAPHALEIGVVGDFNEWDYLRNPLKKIHENGLWEGLIPDLPEYSYYQYAIRTPNEKWIFKSDPYARTSAVRPNTASRLYADHPMQWEDDAWYASRKGMDHRNAPMSIYEMHPGSWRRHEDGSFYSYRDLADTLPAYLSDMGFTHVELMPQSEFPLDDSWGYQITGFFSINSRHGNPEDFQHLINELHKAGIGVLMDFVPAHFCKDAHGLRRFDGMPCFESDIPVRAEHPEWGTCIFDFGRSEVKSFLASAANYWIDEFHIDGLRFDAVTSMLYHDYGRKDGEWLPNIYGGKENLEAIELLRFINESLHVQHPDVLTIAEESTSWPMVTKPPYDGGLGFDYKWDMGWMNDTLHYMQDDPVFHPYHHDALTFTMMYAFSENFINPLSHDEVVHGKHTLLDKMPGSYESKFPQLRLLFGYQYTHPGKKLLFMGSELAPFLEWRFYEELEWHLLTYYNHRHIQEYVRDLNHFYREHPALYACDGSWDGFQWLNPNDADRSVLSYRRTGNGESLVVLCNFSPVTWTNYEVPLPYEGSLSLLFSSDDAIYGGTGADMHIKMLKGPAVHMQSGFRVDLPAFTFAVLAYTRKTVYNEDNNEAGSSK